MFMAVISDKAYRHDRLWSSFGKMLSQSNPSFTAAPCRSALIGGIQSHDKCLTMAAPMANLSGKVAIITGLIFVVIMI